MAKLELVENFKARIYQQTIFAKSINNNSLVILPTGLGKTVIAIMLTTYYFNKNSNKKILFLAPTKPLVEQQKSSFQSFFKNEKDFNFQVLTGNVSPKKRSDLYKENNFIFSTPQLIENDIINDILDEKDFSLIILDEAHRGVGNYAYCFIAERFNLAKTKILALTASPGTSVEEIKSVIENLKIDNLEVRNSEDYDVKPYIKGTEIEYIKVKLTYEFSLGLEKLNRVYAKRIKSLKLLNYLERKSISQISKKDLLLLQIRLRTEISQGKATQNTWDAISICAGILKLSHGIELFESQEISAAYTYFYNFFREGGDKSKAVENLLIDLDFQDSFKIITKLNKNHVKHPKLLKLKEIISKEVLMNPKLKIIIFNQFRDTAQKITSELEKIKEIRPAIFVGQAKKGEVKMTQKDQKRIIEEFREDKFNILISTSVGEEGLDIPKVDLVIFYEPIPSAIRTIQRIGRTGRFSKGKVIILQTENTKEIGIRFVANAKEKKMFTSLKKIQKEISKEKREEKQTINLSNFIKKDNSEEDNLKEVNNFKNIKEEHLKIEGNDIKHQIYIDNRENSQLIKELFLCDELKVVGNNLDIGDIVINEEIAIERKSKKDFVNSIIDKRLFEQLIDLAKNYRRPILIIEGEENIFAIRNLNPNVIRSTLSAIAVDLRIPIIYTSSIFETAQMIRTITRRLKKDKKEISLAKDKRANSENQELEKFVSSIPKINVVNSKSLLQNFKTIQNLVNSQEKDLQDCKGIGKGRAKSLFEFFRRKY